jgi:NADH-quinone oxidoreductase subunit L
MTVICVLLFIGAMGKSAQVPLHIWLPDSMEGPTPISRPDPRRHHGHGRYLHGGAHVAALRTLGDRPEFRHGDRRHHGLLHGLVGLVQNDIKRVVAYSTLSQLGYMVAALGASAYAAVSSTS